MWPEIVAVLGARRLVWGLGAVRWYGDLSKDFVWDRGILQCVALFEKCGVLILFDDLNERKNSGIVLVQLVLSDWGDQLLCDKMLRHFEDNAFIILTDVSGCGWYQVCHLLLSGYLFWTLSFSTVKLFIDLSSGMWVGDCSGRYMTTEQLYWSQFALRMSNRTFYSPSWLEVERRRFYVTSWFGDETPCFWECLFARQRVTHTLSLVLFLRIWIL